MATDTKTGAIAEYPGPAKTCVGVLLKNEAYNNLLKTRSLNNAVREFSLA